MENQQHPNLTTTTRRKRKRNNQNKNKNNKNPLSGIFTRQKTEKLIYSRTRSGKLRPDPVRKTQNPEKISPPVFTMGVGAGIGSTVVDLRAHRVFSEPLVAVEMRSSPAVEGRSVITTPPDEGVLVQRKNGDVGVSVGLGPPADNVAVGVRKVGPLKKSLSSPFTNSVLKPCSRMKVFKAPNSFSYKRLLPYLMDIAKETKVDHSPKTENGVEDKHVLSSDPASQDSQIIGGFTLDETPLRNVPGSTALNGVNIGSNEVKSDVLEGQTVVAGNSMGSLQVSNQEAVSLNGSGTDDTPILDDSHQEILVNEEPASENVGKLGDLSPVNQFRVAVSLDSPSVSPEVLTNGAYLEPPPLLSLNAEGQCRASNVELNTEENVVSVNHNSSKPGAVVSSTRVPVSGLSKGILKRNPRGCRGMCSCLSCSAFRLNAEKAFEFSRNQMLDAEELAVDLMKELSNLRHLLEQAGNGASDHAVIPINQVQQACTRASEMENLARNRLSQMKEDVHVHCRIKQLQRPRVNFSSHVEKKVIRDT